MVADDPIQPGQNGARPAASPTARRAALAEIRARNAARGGTVEVIYWTIRDAIRARILAPGERLIELDLAAAFEVSRTPIREALRRLESEGLVEDAPRRGLVVMSLTLQDLIDIFEIDEVLDGLAARRAAQHMGVAEIEALGQTIAWMERAIAEDDFPALSKANTRFHSLLRSGSKNGRLPSLLSRLHDAAPTLRSHQLPPERAPVAVAEHRDIYEAIAARDPDAAERLARTHAQNALRAHVLAHHLAEAG